MIPVDTASRLAAWREAIERELERTLADDGRSVPVLLEAMRYTLLGGGKRQRPLLTIASCAACSTPADDAGWKRALPAAVAVEMIHAYSLVHDDLPAMDDDDLRRGRPTAHRVYGEALAILAGDALQTRAFQVLSGGRLAPETVVEQIAALADAAGPAGMAGGQVLDLAAEGTSPDAEAIARVDRLKTGALLAACFRLGALAAGADEEGTRHLVRCGVLVGEAFQIQDDILDLTASTAELGKTAGKDPARGKATWPALIGIEAARDRASSLQEAAKSELETFGDAALPLVALVHAAVDRRT